MLRLYALQPASARPETVAKVLLRALAQLPALDYRTCLLLVPERAQAEEPVSTVVLLAAHLEGGRLADFWALATGSSKALSAMGARLGERPCHGGGTAARGGRGRAEGRDRCLPVCVARHKHTVGLITTLHTQSPQPPPSLSKKMTVPGFMDAARRYVAHTLAITFARVSKRQAAEALRLEGRELDAFLAERAQRDGWAVDGETVQLPANEYNTAAVKRAAADATVPFGAVAPALIA